MLELSARTSACAISKENNNQQAKNLTYFYTSVLKMPSELCLTFRMDLSAKPTAYM